MNPVIRIALLIGALLAVVIAGSYFYSRTLQQPDALARPAESGNRPGPEILVGAPIEGDLAAGLQALQDNHLEQARASLERVRADDPGYLIALQNLGNVRAQLGDFAGAREALERLSAIQVASSGTLQLLSRVQFRLGDYEAAEVSLLRALEIDDTDPALRYDLALFRAARSQLPEAIGTYDRAIAHDPSRGSIMTALEHLLALHESRPDLATVHFALAYFGRRLTRPDLELEELEHFLAIEPTGQAAEAARKRLAEVRAGRPD